MHLFVAGVKPASCCERATHAGAWFTAGFLGAAPVYVSTQVRSLVLNTRSDSMTVGRGLGDSCHSVQYRLPPGVLQPRGALGSWPNRGGRGGAGVGRSSVLAGPGDLARHRTYRTSTQYLVVGQSDPLPSTSTHLPEAPIRQYPVAVELQLSERAQLVLRKLQPAAGLAGSIKVVALEAVRIRLRDVVDQIGDFEALRPHVRAVRCGLERGSQSPRVSRAAPSATSWTGKRSPWSGGNFSISSGS